MQYIKKADSNVALEYYRTTFKKLFDDGIIILSLTKISNIEDNVFTNIKSSDHFLFSSKDASNLTTLGNNSKPDIMNFSFTNKLYSEAASKYAINKTNYIKGFSYCLNLLEKAFVDFIPNTTNVVLSGSKNYIYNPITGEQEESNASGVSWFLEGSSPVIKVYSNKIELRIMGQGMFATLTMSWTGSSEDDYAITMVYAGINSTYNATTPAFAQPLRSRAIELINKSKKYL